MKRSCLAVVLIFIMLFSGRTLTAYAEGSGNVDDGGGGLNHGKIESILQKVVPFSTFVGGFPFASSGFNDGEGYYFAKDTSGGLVIVDVWRRRGDRTNSNFREADVQEYDEDILLGRNGEIQVVYYNQLDEWWKEKPYGEDEIGTHGCGPTSMSIVVSTFTDRNVDPVEMARWSEITERVEV